MEENKPQSNNDIPTKLSIKDIIETRQMSKTEYNQQCQDKGMSCKMYKYSELLRKIHEGRRNLQMLQKQVKMMYNTQDGWKNYLELCFNTNGYLDSMINFKFLRQDLLKTVKMIESFRAHIKNLKAFKEDIE